MKLSQTSHHSAAAGPSLARGPAWIVGTVLAVFGLILFFRASGTPLGTEGFPDGTTQGDRFIGFEANAWTAWFTAAAGVAALLGAAQHIAAKVTSLVVGLVVGAASVIALVDGDDVLGLAAANGLTALGWGIAAAVLIVTALLPRLVHEEHVDEDERRAVMAQRPEGSGLDTTGARSRGRDDELATAPSGTRITGSQTGRPTGVDPTEHRTARTPRDPGH